MAKKSSQKQVNAEHVALEIVSDKVRVRLGLKTLETRMIDSLDFHDISVDGIKDTIKMAFEAGRNFEAKQKNKKFRLVHVVGGVDPLVVGSYHKTFEKLLKSARSFYNSVNFAEDKDSLFYIIVNGNKIQVHPFDSSDLEDEN